MNSLKINEKINVKLAIILTISLFLIVGIISAALFFTGKVKVTYGTKVVCKYGEVVKDNVKTENVPRYLASRYKINLEEVICDNHKEIEKMYDAAQKKLESGDKKGALKAFEEIAKLDPKFKDVTATIGQLTGKLPADSGKDSASNGGSSTANNNSGLPDEKNSSLSFMVALLPDKIDGYKTLNTYEGDLNAGRYYEPLKKTEVVRLLISVRDSGKKESASDYLEKNVYLPYSEASKKVTIDKIKVYFGTDGREFAIMGWEKSGVVYQTEMAVSGGKNPTVLYDDLEKVVKLLN